MYSWRFSLFYSKEKEEEQKIHIQPLYLYTQKKLKENKSGSTLLFAKKHFK